MIAAARLAIIDSLELAFLDLPLMWFSGALYPILVAIALRASYYSRVYRPPEGSIRLLTA
jgi:hypothetical protein